ncbi:alpha/beta fold hydrolase [Massilia pseudoviolaceinigra]|uniref:alpha/beta fold hydrolase n=1 Tax=Massilia pseudoviolaceinigra TaxID=3057165 RepID=UPI0027963FB4|nr:alpha/beta hydrolase [Massilia sp. CCM 9206]MDQ1919011.1 alpha/beta hydrolase [Massilia sp. CCM 9206]
MDIQHRNNVTCYGNGPSTLVFGHGFGCDQNMWRKLLPSFTERYKVILYDLVGSGKSDLSAYNEFDYVTLHRHAEDLLEIIHEFSNEPVVFIGHSVSAMIGMLAAIREPAMFAGQVMVGPSPCFINDGDYIGGFNREDIDGLLGLMHDNYLKWAANIAPIIMGAPDQPDLQQELTASFCRNDPEIARHFARVTFLSDHRADVPRSHTPTLVLQSTDDMIAPREVGEYMRKHLPVSWLAFVDNIGHCPHMSAASDSTELIQTFITRLLK